MTTIKPPADPSAASPEQGPGGVDAVAPKGGPSDASSAPSAVDAADFKALVAGGGVEAAPSQGSGAAISAAGPDLSPLVKGIQEGSLTVDAAVEVLLERALGDVGSVLDPDARAELETLLRGALESDPTLIALRGAASES